MKILLVNGINTHRGGANTSILKFWHSSLVESGHKVSIFNTVPSFLRYTPKMFENLYLAFYFFPGTFFRLWKSPFFEFFNKLSIVVTFRLLWTVLINKYDKVIFSHHSSFYLFFLVVASKRNIIVHDLIATRARSLERSKIECRFIFFFEKNIYNLSDKILVLSGNDLKILSKFCSQSVKLIRTMSFTVRNDCFNNERGFAVVSDWRRNENVHGLKKFCSSYKKVSEVALDITLYGFASESMKSKIDLMCIEGIVFHLGGEFRSICEIPEPFFIVPIYQGSGIKTKVLEALINGKIVFGSKQAFVGLPLELKSRCFEVNSLNQLVDFKLDKYQRDYNSLFLVLDSYFLKIEHVF